MRRDPGGPAHPVVAILGGAFDPPHLGHLALARGAVETFAVDRLLVRVVADPGHKEVGTPAVVRLELAECAFADLPQAEVSLEPHGRTVDALAALALDDPLFVIGADELAGFLDWKEPQRVLDLARLAVGTRPGVEEQTLEAVLAAIARPDRITVFSIPPHAISSTEIRARTARGESLAGLVPPHVEELVTALGLYRCR